MPKQKLPVWKHFSVVINNQNKKEYQCIYCKNKYTQNATRLTQHILKCARCPMGIKKTLDRNAGIGNRVDYDHDGDGSGSADVVASTTSQTSSRASSAGSMSLRDNDNRIDRFLDTTSVAEKKKLDTLLARAVYTSGSPLGITENPEWLNFLKALRPAYTPLTRHQLSHTFLNEEYENVRSEVLLKIANATTISLQCDGWSNIRNQAIINYVITTPVPVLFKTLTTDDERHTGEYVASEMKKIIDEIGPSKFFGIVTDNAAAMLKALSIIENEYKFISVYTCACHTLNLLVGDTMKINSLKNVEASCKEIVKEVIGSHINLATFNKIQQETKNDANVVSLKLPVKTRWGSILRCIDSLLASKRTLQRLMISENIAFSRNVRTNCLDNEIFWVRLEKLKLVLDPIVKWITLLESDSCRLSQVVEGFKDIEKAFNENVPSMPITKAEEKECFLSLNNRKRMALKPLHYAANLLDPCFLGEQLNNEEHIAAMKFIHDITTLHPQFLNQKDVIFSDLTNYCAKSGLWAFEYIWVSAKNVDSISWWHAMCKNTQIKNLAVAILSLPPSSSATERSFSTYSFVHNKKRNRLTTERAGKLMFIAHNNKLLRQKNIIYKGQHEPNSGLVQEPDLEVLEPVVLVPSASDTEQDESESDEDMRMSSVSHADGDDTSLASESSD